MVVVGIAVLGSAVQDGTDQSLEDFSVGLNERDMPCVQRPDDVTKRKIEDDDLRFTFVRSAAAILCDSFLKRVDELIRVAD